MDDKRILWIGSSYKDLCEFPEKARKDAGFQLGFVQHGIEPIDWKPIPSVGKGVQEIRINTGGAFRVIYLAKYDEAVYVLHAFQKKTQQTSKKDINLARDRLREVIRMRLKNED